MQSLSLPGKTLWHLALLLSCSTIRSCLVGVSLPFLNFLPQTSTKVYGLCFPIQRPSPSMVASMQWCWHHTLSCPCLLYPFFSRWTPSSQISPSSPELQLCPLLPSWCGMPVVPRDLQPPFGLSQACAEAPESQEIRLLQIAGPDLACNPCTFFFSYCFQMLHDSDLME